jgi:hypothetical protein
LDSLQGAIRRLKPSIFYGENKKVEEVEESLLGMRKYL